jgi:hypothetical protein
MARTRRGCGADILIVVTSVTFGDPERFAVRVACAPGASEGELQLVVAGRTLGAPGVTTPLVFAAGWWRRWIAEWSRRSDRDTFVAPAAVAFERLLAAAEPEDAAGRWLLAPLPDGSLASFELLVVERDARQRLLLREAGAAEVIETNLPSGTCEAALTGFARWVAEGAGDAAAIVEHAAFAQRTLAQPGGRAFGRTWDPHDLLVAWRALVTHCEQGPDEPVDQEADEDEYEEPVDALWARRALAAALAAAPPPAFVAEVAALDARYQAVRPPLPRF